MITILLDCLKLLANYSIRTCIGTSLLQLEILLLKIIFLKINLSDLKIKLSNGTYLKAHKFVLDARSKNWNSQNLSTMSELDLSG